MLHLARRKILALPEEKDQWKVIEENVSNLQVLPLPPDALWNDTLIVQRSIVPL